MTAPGGGLFRRLGAVALFLLLWAGAAPAQEPDHYLVDTGPLRIRDQFLFGLGFLAFDPVSADVLDSGKWQFDVVLTVGNDFAHSGAVEDFLEARSERQPLTLEELRNLEGENPSQGIFLVDGEHYRTAFAVRRGVGKGVQVELVVPVVSFQGGLLDSTVESFHDAFSLGQAGRLGVPKDRFQVYLRSKEGELFANRAPGLSLGDVVVGAKFDVLRKKPNPLMQLAVEGLVKLPTGDEEKFTGSGSTDLGFQILATRYFTKSCIHAAVGLAHLGERDLLGVSRQTRLSGMIAWERAFGSKLSGLAQLTLSQSPFRQLNLQELEAISSQITLGVKRVVGRQVLFFGLTENVANFDNSPDIGFHLGVTRIFD